MAELFNSATLEHSVSPSRTPFFRSERLESKPLNKANLMKRQDSEMQVWLRLKEALLRCASRRYRCIWRYRWISIPREGSRSEPGRGEDPARICQWLPLSSQILFERREPAEAGRTARRRRAGSSRRGMVAEPKFTQTTLKHFIASFRKKGNAPRLC